MAGSESAAADPRPGSGRHASTHVKNPTKSQMVNELLLFLAFVENHPVGSVVECVVESYASHGAYVTVGDALATYRCASWATLRRAALAR
ncbi:MAG: hypothetical protein R2715_19635 [Ilumatobacteraceae bacterium]